MTSEKTCFLSYASEDGASAQKLYTALSTCGIQVWFDRVSLRPGEKWEPAIRRGIRGSRYFLALLSSRAVSKKGFVQREIREALELLSEYADDDIYLIPLRLDECTPSHDRLLELQWLDLFPSWDDGLARLTRFLGVVGAPPPAAPATQPIADDLKSYVRLRFDGLYQSDRRSDCWHYLRFYDDGVVLGASSTGSSPPGIAKWLKREEHGYYSSGSYSLTGRHLSFSTTSQIGTVDYSGTVEGDTIVVKWHSHINGRRGVTQYDFRPVTT